MKIGMIVEMLRKPLREALKTAAEMGVSGVQIYAVYGTDHNRSAVILVDMVLRMPRAILSV